MKAVLKFAGRLAVLGALNLDLVVLRAAKWVVEMAEEWLSLSQRSIERGLMLCALASYACICWGSWWLLLLPLAVVGAWSRHRKPSAQRAADIASAGSIFWRLWTLAGGTICLVFLLVAVLLQFPLRQAAPYVAAVPSLLAFEYVTALPERTDGLGRKRKLALSKLKAMFGTSWLPAGARA